MERIAETPPASPAPPAGRRSGARSRPVDGARGAAPARRRYSPTRRARRSLPWSWPLEAWVDPWRSRGTAGRGGYRGEYWDGSAAEPHPAAGATITRDRAPVPRWRGGVAGKCKCRSSSSGGRIGPRPARVNRSPQVGSSSSRDPTIANTHDLLGRAKGSTQLRKALVKWPRSGSLRDPLLQANRA